MKPRKEKKDESWRDAIAAFVIQVDIVIDNTDNSYHMQCYEKKKRPSIVLPVPDSQHLVRTKKEVKPEKSKAVEKHQTRMRAGK